MRVNPTLPLSSIILTVCVPSIVVFGLIIDNVSWRECRGYAVRPGRRFLFHDHPRRSQNPHVIIGRRRNTYRAVSHGDESNDTKLSAGKDGSPVKSEGNWLRTLASPEFSIAIGVSILLAVLTNRLATPDLVDSQARTDILGVIASGGLITNGVYQLDLNVNQAEDVTLVGRFVQEYKPTLSLDTRRDLQWLAESLLLASAATTVIVYHKRQTLARVGVVGESPLVREAPILAKSLQEGTSGRELYLPALQVLPGKIEFDYLPENCQGVLFQPVLGGSGVVIIGTSRARAFTPKDLAWIKGICDEGAFSLSGQRATI